MLLLALLLVAAVSSVAGTAPAAEVPVEALGAAAEGCIPCTIGQPPRCPNCGSGNPGFCNGTCCECAN
jgi:hypothetical protein